MSDWPQIGHAPAGCVLEAVLVGPADLFDPSRLDAWLCSRVHVAGDRVELVVEEEYGYRRVLDCRLAPQRAVDELVLLVEQAYREWDGCDGTPVGAVAAPSSCDEPELRDTVLRLVTLDAHAALLTWDGFQHGAIDALRREGVLVRHAADRAAERAGGDPLTVHRVELQLDQPTADGWSRVDDMLVGGPGTAWVDPAGQRARGRVLVLVARRRLAASWHAPGAVQPSGMLDVRVAATGPDRSTVQLELAVAGAAPQQDAAAAWLRAAAASLAGVATTPATEA